MIKIVAYQLAENLNIKKFKAEYTGDFISGTFFELFYHFNKGHIYLLSYGVVVFANIDEIDRHKFIELLKPYCSNILEKRHQEDFIIEKNETSNIVFTYNALTIPSINLSITRIAMIQVGQSVALDFYLEKSQQLFDETLKLTNQLELYGKLIISKKDLLKFIGKTLNTRNRIFDDLYILDAPPIVWEDEMLAKVNEGLEKTFDISIRYKEIEYMLKNIETNLDIFIQLMDTRDSQRLEWIVIVLILIEVLHLIANEIFR